MTWALWVFNLIVHLILGVGAGFGFAAWRQRKTDIKNYWSMQADIDNMYIGHGLKPPGLERYLEEHPEAIADFERQSPFGPPEEQIP